MKTLVIMPAYDKEPIPYSARMNDILNYSVNQKELEVIDVSKISKKRIEKFIEIIRIILKYKKRKFRIHLVGRFPFYLDIFFLFWIDENDIIGPNLIRNPPHSWLRKVVREQTKRQIGSTYYWTRFVLLIWLDRIYYRIISRYGCILAMSSDSACIYKELGASPEKIQVLPAVSALFSTEVSKLRDKKIHVMFAGRQDEDKGFLLFKKLAEKYIESGRFVFHAFGKSNGSEINYIIQHGYVPRVELIKWYQLFDLYVQSSYDEQLSVTVIESLHSGTPVLCSDDPSYFHIDYGNISYFRTGDFDSLCSTFEHTTRNLDKLKKLASAYRCKYHPEEAKSFMNKIYGFGAIV